MLRLYGSRVTPCVHNINPLEGEAMTLVSVQREIDDRSVEAWIEETLASQLPGGPYVRKVWESDVATHHAMMEVTGVRPAFFGLTTKETYQSLLSVWVIHGPGVGSSVIVTLYRPEFEQDLIQLMPAIGAELKARYLTDFNLEVKVNYPGQ